MLFVRIARRRWGLGEVGEMASVLVRLRSGGVVPTGRVTRQFGVDLEAICESVQALRRTKVPVKSRTKGKCFNSITGFWVCCRVE